MSRAVDQTLRLVGFTLLEYLRSARIAVELIIALACYYIFLRRVGQVMTAEYLYAVLGAVAPALALYTTGAVIGLGDRPQSYVLLARGVGRGSYLLSLFLCAWAIVAAIYGLICIAVAVLNPPVDLDLAGWLLASLPLLLNIGLVSALMLMLSPLVFSNGWRLLVLGLIALAFSGNFIGGPLLNQINELSALLGTLLRATQTLLGGPLVPAFFGYQLSLSRDFSGPAAWANLVAQASLLIAFLGLANYAFARRDLIFGGQ